MPAQTTLQSTAIARPPAADDSYAPAFRGEWFTIRIKPDLATGERLNVGVALRVAGQTHVKILPTVRPFQLLYGDAGSANFGFLLELLRLHFANGGGKSPSPHLLFEEPKYAAGTDIAQTLDRLYDNTVTLGRILEPAHGKQNLSTRMTTRRLKQAVKQHIQREFPDFAYWQDRPVILKESGLTADVDLYIPQSEVFHRKNTFASLLSLDYENPGQIIQGLAEKQRELAVATTAMPDSVGSLLVYRPPSDDRMQDFFDSELGKTGYLLKDTGITMEVEDSPEKIMRHTVKLGTGTIMHT